MLRSATLGLVALTLVGCTSAPAPAEANKPAERFATLTMTLDC